MATNYLNNKDLLIEIAKSKNTYCEFLEPRYSTYNAIVESLSDLTAEKVAELREIHNIPSGEIVVRIMTNEHIPMLPHPKGEGRADVRAKVPFPPFKHYRIDDGLDPVEVGRSHWRGGFQNGHFDPQRGRQSNTLGNMFKKLVEKYAMRFNWRNYSYREDMEGHALVHLAQVGLQFDESKSSNAFSFFTLTIERCFIRIVNVEKGVQRLRDDLLEINGMAPSHARQMDNDGVGGAGAAPPSRIYTRRHAKTPVVKTETPTPLLETEIIAEPNVPE
jgi:hypothetical protein